MHSIKLPNSDFKDRLSIEGRRQIIPYASKICVHAVENSNFSLVENDDNDDGNDDVDVGADSWKMLENFNGIATNFVYVYCCCCCCY